MAVDTHGWLFRFIARFPDKQPPHRNTVRNLLNKSLATGNVEDAPRFGRPAVSEEKCLDIQNRILKSPSKFSRKMSQQVNVSVSPLPQPPPTSPPVYASNQFSLFTGFHQFHLLSSNQASVTSQRSARDFLTWITYSAPREEGTCVGQMFQQMSGYCSRIVENVYAFLYHFLLGYKSYVVINIVILGLNLILLRTVHYYMSKKKSKHQDGMKIDKTKFDGKAQTKSPRSPRNQINAHKVTSVNVPRPQAQSAGKRNPRSASMMPRTTKTPGKTTAATCQKCVTPPLQVPPAHIAKKQTNGDKCDETLDEITWACDDSHSSLGNTKNVKCCDTQVQTGSPEDARESKSTHICKRMWKSTDVRDDQQRDDEGNAAVKEENQPRKDRIRQDSKKRQKDEDSQTKTKSCAQKKKTGKLKQRQKKIPRSLNIQKQTPSRQPTDTDSGENEKPVCVEVRPAASQEELCEEKKLSVNEARAKRIRKKQNTSPRAIETVKNSSGDSKNSCEESDLELAGSDKQFHGNRSESSLVCKRDSWIWFSPDMRPSVEDFAARQRKFRSRDPRVAELAFEISRQEELNRDIERAAGSLIDSSSPSTCKLHEGSLRVVSTPISHKSRCGAMKNKACRKSRVTPYTLPDIKKLPISPVPVSYLAGGDHANNDGNEYPDHVSMGKAMLKIMPMTSPDKQTEKAKESSTPTPKRRKTRQENNYQKTNSRNHSVVCAESRTTSSASSEHSEHNVGDSIPFEGGSLPHAINWYNSPAANVIRRLYTPSRYSPLYDNTTLVCSTQCSLCSLVSSSLEYAKGTGNPEKNRALKREVTDESKQREGCLVHNGHEDLKAEIRRSPGATNLHVGKYIKGDNMTSPQRRKYYKEVPESSLMSKDGADSCPESPTNVQDRYRDRLSPKWRSSRSSPRKRRFSDRVSSYSNRLAPDNRMESYKYARRSPQLTFSTGESESDSVYRDKSGGPDASYRQCMISKEVNTTVQRLLFDTEKSSSSHSPSSRSKIQFPDINIDEDCNNVAKRDLKNTPSTAHLRESCTRINISRDSPPNCPAETRGCKQESGSDKQSSDSREEQLLEGVHPTTSFMTSESQTCCACHKTQKFTNIYARDYYLGKRVTLKKQLEAKATVHSSKWKKLDIAWCTNAPYRSRSSQNKSRLSSSRRDYGSSTREALKRKPGVKLMTYASRHTHRFHASGGCQVTQTSSATSADNFTKENLVAGAKDDNEVNRNACKCLQTNTSRTQLVSGYKKCNKAKVGFCEIYDKKSALRKIDNSMLHESSTVFPSNKPIVSSRSAAPLHRCKKEECAQPDPSTILATASTNNSSSNLSYSSDKSTSSEKPSVFDKAAQFYFVTRSKQSPETSSHQRDRLGYFQLAKDPHVDMFNNSQLSGPAEKSSTALEPIPVIHSEITNSSGHSHKPKETEQTVCKTHLVSPAYFTTASVGHHKSQITDDRCMQDTHQDTSSLGQHKMCQQDTSSLGQHKMCPAERWNTTSQEVTSGGMLCSFRNLDVSTLLGHSFTIDGDNSHNGRVLVPEEGCTSKSEVLRPFEADTVDADRSNFVTPVTACPVKQSSNPDSGYDESLSEKANGDCSLQMSLATAVDSSQAVSSPHWLKLQMSNWEQRDTKSGSISPLSDGSRNSDHAHRSHISNDCDSEQDTLPSLSDDTFQTSSNFDPLIHPSPDTHRGAQNAHLISRMTDVTRQNIYQRSSFNRLNESNSSQGLKKDAKTIKADDDWTSHHNIEHETSNPPSKRKLLSDSNQLYLKKSSWNATARMAGCHTAVILLPPASIENEYTDQCQGMIPVPKKAPEGCSHNAELGTTDNTDNTSPNYVIAHMPTVFHFHAKPSETAITKKDTEEVLTQVSSKQTWPGVIERPPEWQGTEKSNALYKSTCNRNSLESRASNLAQSDKDIVNVWSAASQNERMHVTSLLAFNSQGSKERWLTSRTTTPPTRNNALDWPPLETCKLEDTRWGALGEELEANKSDNACRTAGNSQVKTMLNPCHTSLGPIGEDLEANQSDNACRTAGNSQVKTMLNPCHTSLGPLGEDLEANQSDNACSSAGNSQTKTVFNPCRTRLGLLDEDLQSHQDNAYSSAGNSHAQTVFNPCRTRLGLLDEDLQSHQDNAYSSAGNSHAQTVFNPCRTRLGLLNEDLQSHHQDNASRTAGNRQAKTIFNPCRLTVCAEETPGHELPESITLPPTSSDEEDAAGGGCSHNTHVLTSDQETVDNCASDYLARQGITAPSSENGVSDPQRSAKTDTIHKTLANKPHQNNYKQHTNMRFSNQAKNKVFISDRSIAFSDILKRF